MAMAGIVDDIVKGIKKFGDDVIEGAKNGPGKAARIKKTATLTVNGNKMGMEDIIKGSKNMTEDVVKRGRKNIDSLSDYEKTVFKNFEKHADSSGSIKNYEELIAKEFKRVGELSGDEFEKELSDVFKQQNQGFVSVDKLNTQKAFLKDAKDGNLGKFLSGTVIEGGTVGQRVGDFTGGGIYGSYNAYKNMADGKKSIMGAIKEGHSVVNDAGEKVISGKKVAGTATTVAAAGALGNRVFRDEYGELDVPVVPFI